MVAAMDDVRDLVAERSAPAYDGFPWWRALLVKSSGEMKAAQWLHRVRVFVYLPTFTRHVHRRGKIHHARQQAVVSGMLFVPEMHLNSVPDELYDRVLDMAGVYGMLKRGDGSPASISKADIELVRLMEAKVNLPQEVVGVSFKVGQEVRFKDASLWLSWIGGTIFEIADYTRIGVEIPRLFGRTCKIYVPATEIEVM